MTSLRSPLGRVLGLGSAKSGYGHWWGQRLTAAALVPLGLWFLFSVATLPGSSYPVVAAWAGELPHAVLLVLLLATLLRHSSLGLQVIVEDYVHHGPTRLVSIVLINFAHVALAVAGIYAVVLLSTRGFA